MLSPAGKQSFVSLLCISPLFDDCFVGLYHYLYISVAELASVFFSRETNFG